MAKAPKLKVYCMPAGFYDALVAASSQAAALKAWGTTTNLFAVGRASLVEDEALQAEALARPGEVIRRMRGDEAAMLGPEPAEPFEPRSRPAEKGKSSPKLVAPPAPRRPPDRSRLDATERALDQAEAEFAASMGELAIERAALDRRESDARHAGERRIEALRRDRDRAAAAYERVANDNPHRS